jgi:hypothetical protein
MRTLNRRKVLTAPKGAITRKRAMISFKSSHTEIRLDVAERTDALTVGCSVTSWATA